jgi:hypothetical protein
MYDTEVNGDHARKVRRLFGHDFHKETIHGVVHYLIKSMWTPTRNCNLTSFVTHFPVVDINSGWAHPLPL